MFLHAIAIAALAALLGHTEADAAETARYPIRPIRFIVPFPPGGGTDTVARIISGPLGKRLGQQIVIDNRGGANAIIGSELAANAPPDGYTMLFVIQANMAVNPTLYDKLPYDPQRDFAPVILLDTLAQLLVVNPSLPVKTVGDLIQMAKAKPGQLNFSSSGHGSSSHLAGELLNTMARVDMVHVPFKGGGPANLAVITGQVQLTIGIMVALMPHVSAGKVRAVAVATPKRVQSLPDVPTIAETLPGYDSLVWHGVMVPTRTPRPIVRALNAALNDVLHQPEIQARLTQSGVQPAGGSPEEFAALIKSETAKYAKLLRQVGLAGSEKR